MGQDAKELLKRLERYEATVQAAILERDRKIAEAIRKDKLYKEKRRWDPDAYEIHASGVDEVAAIKRIEEAVASARWDGFKTELAKFEAQKHELIEKYAAGLGVDYDTAVEISTYPGAWLGEELAKIDAAGARWDRENPPGLSQAEHRDLEERIRSEDFGKNGSFELAGGRGMVVHVEVVEAVSMEPPKEATIQQTSQSGRSETTKAQDTVSDSTTTHWKANTSGEFGKKAPSPTGGWEGKVTAGYERGESRTQGSSHTGGNESGGQRSNSTVTATKGSTEWQSVTLRATVIAPDGTRTAVDMGRVETVYKRP